ncbi:hypothetical protein AMTR_s00057p00147680 [Amborella trichopoda]|uniref:NAB domain-containing protein n=2 Tax=Amborella trichopoda TaxID=13333 RepID=U5D900_AMBTC|nr:hypothetical protein AMTR_s00057p00147680 [Amborella trichopoda]
MLKLIEEDADSFAQRAEMYYKKRPELIAMVEDFYRAYRSLAERHDQLKCETGCSKTPPPLELSHSRKYRSPPQLSFPTKPSPLSNSSLSTKTQPKKLNFSATSIKTTEPSESFDSEESEAPSTKTQLKKLDFPATNIKNTEPSESFESEESEIDDAEEEMANVETEEMLMLREEVMRLREENRQQKEELMERNEEKREVIRQLSLSIDILNEENQGLVRCLRQTKLGLFEFMRWKGAGKSSNGSSLCRRNLVAR